MGISTKIAMVANKVTLRAAERSTNAKISELEEKGYKIESVQTSAHPVPDDDNPSAIRLLWLSLIIYKVTEEPTNKILNPKEPVIIIEEDGD